MRRFTQKIIPWLFDSLVLMCCCFYTADNADKQNFIVFKPQRLGEEKSLAPVNESMSQQWCADDFWNTVVVLIKLSLWPKWWDACANRLQAWLCFFLYFSWWYCGPTTSRLGKKNRRLFGGWNFPAAASLLTWREAKKKQLLLLLLFCCQLLYLK